MANEWKDIGREVRDAVLDAVNSGDYSQLNRRITGSVNAAIHEVNEHINRRKWESQEPSAAYRTQYRTEQQNPYFRQNPTTAVQLYQKKPKGSISGLLLTIFGSILLAAFGLALFTVTMVGIYAGWGSEFTLVNGIMLPFAVGGAVMLGIGIKRRGFVRRFKTYVAAIRDRNYCAISELAQRIGKKESYILQDLREMIARNWFCQAHIDDEGKTLLLTDAMYQQYLELKHQRQKQTDEQRDRDAESEEERLYRETAEKGKSYIMAIRRANDEIPGEVVSEKLYRLETIVSRIFDQIREQPQQIPELRRFLEYYMPTTLKLVETYRVLDGQSISGQNIETAKQEIERTLDTINQAFENLFDSLFVHTAVDITSDIDVLKAMLQQEGLTDKDFVL